MFDPVHSPRVSRIVSLLIPFTSGAAMRSSGISPLHVAAEKDRDDALQLLIESGFDVNARLSEQRSRMFPDHRSTALYFSVYNGNLEAAEMLLEAGADPNLDVFNPLFIAVRLGWVDMAMLLLTYGADVNARISTQPSSFPSAVLLALESPAMLKLLLDHGCDARPCFDCPYGPAPHPAVTAARRSTGESHFHREESAHRHIQVSWDFELTAGGQKRVSVQLLLSASSPSPSSSARPCPARTCTASPGRSLR